MTAVTVAGGPSRPPRARGFASKRVRLDGMKPVEMKLLPRGGFTLILD